MTLTLILLMILAAFAATFLYTIIGIIPGTDETTVLVAITAILVGFGLQAEILLAFFIGAIVSLNLTDSIPTALTSIPGGVMSTPLVESSQYLKDKGLTATSIKKMTMGSLIGTIVAIPAALLIILIVHLINTYTPFKIDENVKKYTGQIFFAGAIFLALLSKNKKISLLMIIPFAFIVIGAQELQPIILKLFKASDATIKSQKLTGTPFFLSITSGPLIAGLILLVSKKERNKITVYGKQKIQIESKNKGKIDLGKIITKKEAKKSIIASILASITFFLSPVGMTLLIGDSLTSNEKDEEEKAKIKVTIMNAIANASYLAGVLISLYAFKIAISPAAMGPGAEIFKEGSKVLDLSLVQGITPILIGVIVALAITIYLSLKYATEMTTLVFKYISHESVLILLLSIFALLVYIDSGIIGVLIIVAVSFISGIINKMGVNYGVQFMAFYASGFLKTQLLAILKLLGMM